MATVAETVAALAPAYTGDARIAVLSPLAAQRVNVAAWGTLYTQGVAYLTIHMLLQADRNTATAGTGIAAGAGPVSSLREGAAAIGFGAPAGMDLASLADADLSTTWAGLAFLSLRATLPASPLWVRPG